MSRKNPSLQARVLLLSTLGIVATGLLSLGVAMTGLKSIASRLTEAIYSTTLEGTLKTFETSVINVYGVFTSDGAHILGDGGLDPSKSSQVVDNLTRQVKFGAAILGHVGTEYKAIQTSIRDANAQRALGAVIPEDSPAGAALAAGEGYTGRVSLAGAPFLVALEPLAAEDGTGIGALLIGQSLAEVDRLTRTEYRNVLLRLVLAMSLAVIVGCALAIALLRSSIVPLRRIVEALGRIAAVGGDLTCRIESRRNDETGQLAEHFNTFLGRLCREFSAIKRESAAMKGKTAALERGLETTSESTDRIRVELETLSGQISEQSGSVSESTSAVEQITRNIEKLDRRILEMARGIQASASRIGGIVLGIAGANGRVQDLAAKVNALKKSSEAGRAAMEEARERVLETSRQSNRVLELNELIAGVAARTNILAINAAIEAAHAGSSGSGFAVVADEIRCLAEESRQRAKETANAIEDIREAEVRLIAVSEIAGSSFQRIDDSVTQTDRFLSEIVQDMAGQKMEAESALKDLSSFHDSAEALMQGSAQMKEGSSLIADEMRRLLALSKEIEGGIHIIAGAVAVIAQESKVTAQVAGANSQSAAALDASLSPYRTE